MGLLDRFKSKTEASAALPSGSFTVDRDGTVLVSTIATRFSPAMLQEIAQTMLRNFAEARKADLSLSELNVKFGAMDIRAVEMRGGAMIFLSPRRDRQNRI
jgi:hypothetical protein